MNLNTKNFNFSDYKFNTSIYDHRILPELIDSSKRNLTELIKLINRLFDHHSRLLVVRIDLRYEKQIANKISLELVQMHREQLLADRRNHPEVFEGMLGYAWGFDCGEQEGGYHYHLLAIYNGAVRRDDIGIGLAIRDIWNKITNGCAQCYISNFDKNKLEREGNLGIGMIHRDDVSKRMNLIEKVAPYITKKCWAFDLESGRTESGSFRTFGRSWMPSPLDRTVPRRGRPPVRDL